MRAEGQTETKRYPLSYFKKLISRNITDESFVEGAFDALQACTYASEKLL